VSVTSRPVEIMLGMMARNAAATIGIKATTYPGIFKLDGDRLIVCWNLEPWTSPKAGGQLVFSPDGEKLAVSSGNGQIEIFTAPPAAASQKFFAGE